LLVWHRRKKAQVAQSWLGAFAAIALLLVAFAAPISAAQGGNATLTDAAVSPRTGTPSTTIVISVVYHNQNGSPAERVTATMGELTMLMTRQSGSDWRAGVTFRWAGPLPVGTYAVTLDARARDRSQASLAAGSVTISPVARPTPTPKPTATPRPTTTPAPKPTPRPTATAVATARPTPRPTTAPTTGPVLTIPGPAAIARATFPSMQPLPTDTAGTVPPPLSILVPSPSPGDLPLTALAGTTTGGTTAGGSNGDAGSVDGRPRDAAGGWGPVANLFGFAGFHDPTFPGLSLAPTLVTTTGLVATAMAFGLFGRRRRDDDEPPDGVLAAAAASGIGVVPRDMVGATVAGTDAAIADGIPANRDDLADAAAMEALMPRWRRPSLIQARKTDPIRDTTPAPRLTFDRGLVGPLDGRERRVVRYRVVRLLDTPDELRGAELGYLDRGDEVQLLEKYGAYWLVLSPDGRQGWLHKMTLGDVVEADGPAPEGPIATMPIAADSWTMGDADTDGDDAFGSYLESRRRDD
jgi:hypothetical protein